MCIPAATLRRAMAAEAARSESGDDESGGSDGLLLLQLQSSQLGDEVVSELAALTPDLRNVPAMAAENKNLAAFLADLASPASGAQGCVASNLAVVLPMLKAEAYSIRSAVCSSIASVVRLSIYLSPFAHQCPSLITLIIIIIIIITVSHFFPPRSWRDTPPPPSPPLQKCPTFPGQEQTPRPPSARAGS